MIGDWSVSQSVSELINHSASQLVSVNQSTSQQIGKFSQPVSNLFNLLLSKSINQSIGRSVSKSLNQFSQPVNQIVSQSMQSDSQAIRIRQSISL